MSSEFILYTLAPSDNDDDRWYEADAARRWMSFAGARSGWPLGCPSSVLARHWRSSGATNASSLGRSIELRLVFRGGRISKRVDFQPKKTADTHRQVQ